MTQTSVSRLRQDFHLALTFLTRLPVPAMTERGDLARSMRVFPLIGMGVGGIGGVVFCLAHAVLPPLAAAMCAVLATILVTGALHEDGLADMADGLGARGGRDQRLAVMRDSRSGAFGVIALVVSLGLRAACLAGFDDGWAGGGALIAAHAWSRALIPAAMQVMAPARTDGLAHGAGQPDATQTALAAALGIGLCVLCLGSGAASAVLLALAAAGIITILARKHLGGHTGDVLGSIQQVAEMAVLAAAVAGVR